MKATKHLSAGERRAVTVDTVIELASEQNPSDITTAAIAARMNLTQGALFRHFPSKDALWEAVMTWVSETLLERTAAAARNGGGPLKELEAMFVAHIDFVVRHPGVPRMMFGELQRAADTPAKRLARALIARYAERLASVIEAGQSGGDIDPGIDPGAAAILFIGTVQGLVMQSLLANDITRIRERVPAVFAIYRRGIARTP